MSIVNRSIAAAPGSYATAAEVRAMSGLNATYDISDADLNEVILTATLIFCGHVTVRLDGAVPEVMDTARKVFQLPTGLIADQSGDATVDANDLTVRFYKVDTDGQILTSATGTVTVQDSTLGVIKTANALPEDYYVAVDYAYYIRPLELARAKRAVRYLAAHIAHIRVKTPGRITMADIQGGLQGDGGGQTLGEATMAVRTRWIDLYRREVAAIVGMPVA
jgi:hypothetical protein